MAYTATTDMNTIPIYYHKVFLERLLAKPVLLDYCIKKDLPQNSGKTIYFPSMTNRSTTPSAHQLVEGTVVTPQKNVDSRVSATIEQFGDSVALRDFAELTAIDGYVTESVKTLADQAAGVIDSRIS